jgi:hypothetical protein
MLYISQCVTWPWNFTDNIICCFHVRLASMIKPRNFISVALGNFIWSSTILEVML